MKKFIAIFLLSAMTACASNAPTPPVPDLPPVASPQVDLAPLVDSNQVGSIVLAFMKKYPKAPYTQVARAELVKSLTDYFDAAKNAGIINDFRIVCDNTNNPDTKRVVVDLYLLDYSGVHAFARSIP